MTARLRNALTGYALLVPALFIFGADQVISWVLARIYGA